MKTKAKKKAVRIKTVNLADPKHMAKLLVSRLNKHEFLALREMMDQDAPAGPFYCAVSDEAVKLFPELFENEMEKP